MSSADDEATLWETPPLMKEEGVKDAADPTRREAIASFMVLSIERYCPINEMDLWVDGMLLSCNLKILGHVLRWKLFAAFWMVDVKRQVEGSGVLGISGAPSCMRNDKPVENPRIS